jgi:hypothetical protein
MHAGDSFHTQRCLVLMNATAMPERNPLNYNVMLPERTDKLLALHPQLRELIDEYYRLDRRTFCR